MARSLRDVPAVRLRLGKRGRGSALWAVQRRYGWCTPEGIRQAAQDLVPGRPAALTPMLKILSFHTKR